MALRDRLRPQRRVAAEGVAPPPLRALPSSGIIRRERRALERLREQRIRDLGGLVLEMYRRDEFREELLLEACAELVHIDARLNDLSALLAAAGQRRQAPAVRCACGAPILWGSHFCANCGRPVGSAPVVACASCGNPLPADVTFCSACGTPVDTSANGPAELPPPGEAAAEPKSDPWER